MRSSPLLQLTLDFDGHFPDSFTLSADSFITSPSIPVPTIKETCRRNESGELSSTPVRFIFIGSGHSGTTRHYISSNGFPWSLDVRTLEFRRGFIGQNDSPALRDRGAKRRIYLTMNHKNKLQYIHRIVAQYFLNDGKPIPPGYEVDHLDGNTQNNAVSNLEIVLTAENYRRRNLKHGYKHMSAHARAAAARHSRQRSARLRALRLAAQQSTPTTQPTPATQPTARQSTAYAPSSPSTPSSQSAPSI